MVAEIQEKGGKFCRNESATGAVQNDVEAKGGIRIILNAQEES